MFVDLSCLPVAGRGVAGTVLNVSKVSVCRTRSLMSHSRGFQPPSADSLRRADEPLLVVRLVGCLCDVLMGARVLCG